MRDWRVSIVKKVEANLNMYDLGFLSAFASSPELADRMKKAEMMLKQKVQENWGVEVGSPEWEDMTKMQHWVSSDPEMAEKIRRAKEILRLVDGMVVAMELTKDELEGLMNGIKGFGGVDDMRRRLQEAHGKF
jgi:hypothetical protein